MLESYLFYSFRRYRAPGLGLQLRSRLAPRMGQSMENFAAPFIELIDREPADLSADEADSLEYYYASVNLAEGVPADSARRRWCLMAQNVGRLSRMLRRLPRSGDPGATPEILAWISAQHGESLTSYQRARLRSLPGGDALVP